MGDEFEYKGYIVSPSGIELAGDSGKMGGFYPGAHISRDVGSTTVDVPYTWDEKRFKTRREAIEYACNAARALIDAGKVGVE